MVDTALYRSVNNSCVYTRVLNRVQLASGHEPSSNPPMDVGWVNPGYNPVWGELHQRRIQVESGLELLYKRGLMKLDELNVLMATMATL